MACESRVAWSSQFAMHCFGLRSKANEFGASGVEKSEWLLTICVAAVKPAAQALNLCSKVRPAYSGH